MMKKFVLSCLILLSCFTLHAQVKLTQDVIVKDFQFYNIFPCAVGNEERTARDMIEYRQRTGHDIALYSLSLHPEGLPASKKAETYTESYRKVKAALKGSGVRLGVLIQSILGHWPRVDRNEEKWTRSINIKGEAVRYCPLDPDFRNYIFQTIVNLAKEDPVLFMGDDDIRGYSHDAECFCHFHVARFNEMTGKKFNSESMREAVKKCKVGDEIFVAFRKMQQEMVDGVGTLIRQAIDSVNPAIPGASCMPGEEMRFNNTVAKAFAAKGQPPIMRICNGNYGESTTHIFPYLVLHTQALREAHRDIPLVIEEADTFPHSLFSKSSAGMNAKFCLSIMSDVVGAKIWLVNAHKMHLPINRNYTDLIAEYDGLYQELTRTVRGTRKTGVAIPMHKRFLKWHPLTPNGSDEFFLEPANWGEKIFGIFGVPYYGTYKLDEDSIYALAGANSVHRLADDELMTLLKGRLLVDGPAAVELCKRGFAKYLGVNASYKNMSFRFDFDDVTGQQYPVSRQAEFPCLEPLDKKIQVISSFCYAPFSASKEMEKVAPANTVYRNSLGGTVAVSAVSVKDMYYWNLNTDARKIWVTRLLDTLNGTTFPNIATANQHIVVMSRKTKDNADLLAVFNLNFDPLKTVELRTAAPVRKLQCLMPDGKWQELPVKIKDGKLVIEKRLECYRFLVLKVN